MPENCGAEIRPIWVQISGLTTIISMVIGYHNLMIDADNGDACDDGCEKEERGKYDLKGWIQFLMWSQMDLTTKIEDNHWHL